MLLYVIIDPSITRSANGVEISLNLHDKMALLNGECGGTLSASTVFNEIEDIDEDGNIIISSPTIFQIIQELVHHFGGEQIGKILISDIENRAKQVMKWTGSTPLYLYEQMLQTGRKYFSFSTNYQELEERQRTGGGTIRTFTYGQDIGYILTNFSFPGELVGNAGETVVTILDKIKNVLGNYEYFYDINGNFRFQEIKNYLNKSYSTFLINEINADNYLIDYAGEKAVYTFENSNIIQSYSNTPQYQQIKNDFVVWGIRKSTTGVDIPIRYHLAIDKKPKVGNTYDVFFFIDPDDGIKKAKKPLEFESSAAFPEKGDVMQYYYAKNTGSIYKWNAITQTYEITPYSIKSITTTDFRTELYMSGVLMQPFGLESNYYFAELKNEWPKIYDIQHGHFFEEAIQEPSSIDFFLDFIDSVGSIAEFGIDNIGRRTNVIVENSINCVFTPNNPDLVIIEAGSADADSLQQECQQKRQDYVQVYSQIYNMLTGGGSLRPAYEEIKQKLYQYTNYNEQVSVTLLPIYYLEPNTRITIQDAQSGLNNDFMIKTISLPLDINSAMNLSCTKVMENI